MAPHSSALAWQIPWTEEPGRLQSIGSLRVGHRNNTEMFEYKGIFRNIQDVWRIKEKVNIYFKISC